MENLPLISVLVMLAGGWLVEIWGAKNVERWLVANKVEFKKGNGMIRRFKNSHLYWKTAKQKNETAKWAMIYVGGVLISTLGVFLLLYLKATNKI